MPKIVDHAQRRDQIALVACRVVAKYGFEQTTIARIAREAGYTTGMVAHYFDTKQDIIVAALRLILRRIEERLTRQVEAAEQPDLLGLLTEALPVDEKRFIECAFWTAYWGQVLADKRLRRVNVWMHRAYMRLFERCFAQSWPQWPRWPADTRDQVLRSVVTLINGLTASAVASPSDWPPEKQIGQLRLQLGLLKAWADATTSVKPSRRPGGVRRQSPSSGGSASG